MVSDSSCKIDNGAFGLMPDPAIPAPSGLIEPDSACFGAFLSPAAVSSGAISRPEKPASQLTCLDLSGSIRSATVVFSLEENTAWT